MIKLFPAMLAFVIVFSASPALSAGNPCAAAKVKAAQRYASCVLTFEARGLKRDKAVSYSRCSSSLTRAWSKLGAKCGFSESQLTPQDIKSLVDEAVSAIRWASRFNQALPATSICSGSQVESIGKACVRKQFPPCHLPFPFCLRTEGSPAGAFVDGPLF